MQIESATHQGLVRQNNEDRFLVKHFENGTTLLALADGMGGHAGGEIAAELALENLIVLSFDASDPGGGLLAAFGEAHKAILDAARFDSALIGMGTTLTAALIFNKTAYWVHVGDSRLYLFHAGNLDQVTCDHTIPGELLRRGEISREQARVHPYGNVLMRCAGCQRFEPETGAFEIEAGDLLMLSSDGLHDLIPDSLLKSILARDTSLADKLDKMFNRCLAAGGRDNITSILAGI